MTNDSKNFTRLEVGQTYKSRSGVVHTIESQQSGFSGNGFFFPQYSYTEWYPDGSYLGNGKQHEKDLIEKIN
jgi:hypothetical protein